MIAVSNCSPLIAFVQIRQLELLHRFFETVLIPEAVAREAAARSPNMPEALGSLLAVGAFVRVGDDLFDHARLRVRQVERHHVAHAALERLACQDACGLG